MLEAHEGVLGCIWADIGDQHGSDDADGSYGALDGPLGSALSSAMPHFGEDTYRSSLPSEWPSDLQSMASAAGSGHYRDHQHAYEVPSGCAPHAAWASQHILLHGRGIRIPTNAL